MRNLVIRPQFLPNILGMGKELLEGNNIFDILSQPRRVNNTSSGSKFNVELKNDKISDVQYFLHADIHFPNDDKKN